MACQAFFKHKDTPNSIESNLTEIIVSDEDGNHYCYMEKSPKLGSWGWCNVGLNAAEVGNRVLEVDSWGFCSKDCKLSEEGK